MKQFSSIELFAGAGGLAQGLALTGFHPKIIVEKNQNACQTLRQNTFWRNIFKEDSILFEGDVKNVNFEAFQGVDLVSGGPPCQPFSIGGKHKGPRDNRDMFPQAIRAVRETQPKAFILENVKGITRKAFYNYFEYIKMQLQYPEIKCHDDESWVSHLARLEQHHLAKRKATDGFYYNLVTQSLQAADYGVPQRRERIFFVGFRNDLSVSWHFPTPTHAKEALLFEQHVSNAYWEKHNIQKPDGLHVPAKIKRCLNSHHLFSSPLQPWRTVRDAFVGLPNPYETSSNNLLNHDFIPGARTYPGHSGSPLDEPSKTLKAGDHGVPGGENMVRFTDGSVRYFTVREAARLQTFKDDYYFSGAWSETMRQLGNAVPVHLATILAEGIAQALSESHT